MDSPRSDTFDLLDRLRESMRRGDWKAAAASSTALQPAAVPRDRDELCEYLRRLRETLVVAKAWRAHAQQSRARLHAAAKFQASGQEAPAGRHNFGV